MSKAFIQRIIPLEQHLKRKSVLLLGPRRTGKSHFITHQLKPDLYINLLEADVFRSYAARPELLREKLNATSNKGSLVASLVAIDEIQKLPLLMDEVHSLIESKGTRFILTGSSARKLKRNHTSLMAGRAKKMHMHPFVTAEMKRYDLMQILQYGALPPVFTSTDPWDELRDYTGLYLKEEIQAEAFVRKIENFSRFLDFAAMTSGQLLNFESLASDAQVPARTIREYYGLLEDTLMGEIIYPMAATKRRKSTSTGKFYFFDCGVLNAIVNRKSVSKKTTEYGLLFEHFIYQEIRAYLNYFSPDSTLEFWRVHDQCEVDVVINHDIAIEVKATETVTAQHLKGLDYFSESGPCQKKIVVSHDKQKRKIGDTVIYPYHEFLENLWAGKIV